MSSFGIPVRNGLGVGLLASTSLSTRNSSAFSPASLFAAGEQGAWYDPSDLTSMRQLSTGVTAVTAAAQPVGFIADKRLMGGQTFDAFVAGQPELLPADLTTEFTGTANIAVNPTSIVATNANAEQASASLIVADGTWYQVSFTVAVTSGVGPSLRFGSPGINDFLNLTDGSYTYFLQADGTAIGWRAVSTGSWSVTGFSIKAIPGNHATQSNAAQRPTYGIVPATGRRNLLTYTEQFDNAAWTKSNATVTANAAVAPDGTTTADALIADNAGGSGQVFAQQNFATVSGTTYTISAYVKAGTLAFAAFNIFTGFVNSIIVFNLTAISASVLSGSATAAISDVGNGWFRCSVTAVSNATTGAAAFRVALADDATDTNYIVARNGTNSILIWGAQLEVGSTATAYQRVGTAFDVTEAGVASMSYLSFDGSDDGMLTSNIVPGTDKAQVFAGVRKLSDAARGYLLELSTAANTGTISIQAPNTNGTANYEFLSFGTIARPAIARGFTAPTTNVLTGISDIAADTAILRADGVQVASNTGDQGTGNYLTYPLYIGRRGGSSLPFNGQIFSLIVRFGANLLDATVTQTETWLGQRVSPTVNIPLWQSQTIYNRSEVAILDRANETIEVR